MWRAARRLWNKMAEACACGQMSPEKVEWFHPLLFGPTQRTALSGSVFMKKARKCGDRLFLKHSKSDGGRSSFVSIVDWHCIDVDNELYGHLYVARVFVFRGRRLIEVYVIGKSGILKLFSSSSGVVNWVL
jgi:hypothetical protein